MTTNDPTYTSLVEKLDAVEFTDDERQLLDAILAVVTRIVKMETEDVAAIDVEFDGSFTPDKATLLQDYLKATKSPGDAASGGPGSIKFLQPVMVKGISRT